jgi:hypothetical protein
LLERLTSGPEQSQPAVYIEDQEDDDVLRK